MPDQAPNIDVKGGGKLVYDKVRKTIIAVRPEPDMRQRVIRLLWEKQFEGSSPWAGKFHLMRPDSLEADYGTLADKIITAVMDDVCECFVLTDRRQPGA